MARRTFNRQPFSVDPSDYAPRDGFFTQAEFKGLCDTKNDTTVDQLSFADVKNICIDDEGVLTSRPPFKIDGEDNNIVEQWNFGQYIIRLYKSKTLTEVIFTLRCISHKMTSGEGMYEECNWSFPIAEAGGNFLSEIFCAQIEDKIFVWFSGVDFVALNTAGRLTEDGTRSLYFEDAVKYLYLPIGKLIINGIESEFESENFFTQSYKRRHQYSSLSSVNFEKLINKDVRVSLTGDMTQNTSQHLYDITVSEHQGKLLIYPHSSIGNNYHLDIVTTSRATVIMRYSIAMHTIEISFDGKHFEMLPSLENVVGNPLLTRDGMWVVAFTTTGLARCPLVAQNADDPILWYWITEPYLRYAIVNGTASSIDELDTSFTPVGYFETIDQFAYIIKGRSIYTNISANIQYLYTEWLSGSNDVIWAHRPLISIDPDVTTFTSSFMDDDLKIHFRYVAPTLTYPDIGPVVSVLAPHYGEYLPSGSFYDYGPSLVSFYFRRVPENINRRLQNGDRLFINSTSNVYSKSGYVYKLDGNGKFLVNDDNIIRSDDVILYTPVPVTISAEPDYNSVRNYNVDDLVTHTDYYVYKCIKANSGIPVTNTEYWIPFVVNFPVGGSKHVQSYVPLLDGVTRDPKVSWLEYYLQMNNTRFRISSLTAGIDGITPNEAIYVSSYSSPTTYSAEEWANQFNSGLMTWHYENADGTEFTLDVTDFFIYPTTLPTSYGGTAWIPGVNNTAEVERVNLRHLLPSSIVHNDTLYTPQGFALPCNQMDFTVFAPTVGINAIYYDAVVAYSVLAEDEDGNQEFFDCISESSYEYVSGLLNNYKSTAFTGEIRSRWFKVQPNSNTVLTDLYLYIEDTVITLPQNGKLLPKVEDEERTIVSNDNLVLYLQENDTSYDGNIHRLTLDGISLAPGVIKSGDLISYTKGAVTEKDYLEPLSINYNSGAPTGVSNRFYVESLSGNEYIKPGDLIRLRAYNEEIVLPVGNPGNPYDRPLVISPLVYPATPTGWTVGDDWPESFPSHPPLVLQADGTYRSWAPGDVLPTGSVMYYGRGNLFKRIIPLTTNDAGVWYNIDGTLWTSQLSDDNIIELDEYINCDSNRRPRMRIEIPRFASTLNEHYFVFHTEDKGQHVLEVTATRRDEDKLFSNDGTDLLLYLPKVNEQVFPNTITNLHPLSDNYMAVFTDNEVWYVHPVSLSDNLITYTKPIKSKIPVGCRMGDDIITAFDGQALIFATPRGITAMAPETFVATTEPTLSYLSDAIQYKYNHFYNDKVMTITDGLDPTVKIRRYRYWILFYRFMDREILLLDTRNNSWWSWSTPYPIKSINVDSRLRLIMQIDRNVGSTIVNELGTPFVFADREVLEDFEYKDDTIDRALNGEYELIFENKFVGYRRVYHYASPVINWYITSQKLHFNAINNYKQVKALNMSLRGEDILTAKLSAKAFRDLYHPEQSVTMEIKVRDLRTFVKRMNLMHVTNFQYTLENDEGVENAKQLKLNSLSIKYEVKEKIR